MRDFIAGQLIEPLGMISLTPEFDAKGTMIGGSIMHATARDYAKFGEFLRHHGVVNGQRLLPESWMRFMLTPSANDAGYGGHIWLNRSRPAGGTPALRSEEHTSELQSLMRISYAVFCLKKKKQIIHITPDSYDVTHNINI